MNPNVQSAGSSLHQENINTKDRAPDQGTNTFSIEDYSDQYFQDAIGSHYDSLVFSANHEPDNQELRSTNEFSQYQASSKTEEENNSVSCGRDFAASPLSASRHDEGFMYSIENQTMVPDPNTHNHRYWNKQPEETYLEGRGSSAAAQLLQEPLRELNMPKNQEEGYKTKFEPFGSLFASSKVARDYRRMATRFEREPYLDPASDPTICEIELDRHMHVERIYNAMIRGDKARDNPGSIAIKRWVIEAQYPANLVEAVAHKVFDILMSQVKYGFRGWVHNDYVADERKGEDIDKDVDCAGRLENIILALEQEKTICEDVMNSACQIRMFVNAPKAYANRKQQNRVGNSKRRKRDTPEPSHAAKSRRTSGRQARPRSTTLSETTTLNAIPEQNFSYHNRVRSASTITSEPPIRPMPLYGHNPAMPRVSFDQRSIPAMSPPVPSPRQPNPLHSQMPRMTAAPPPRQNACLSPPQRAHDVFTAQATSTKADSAYPWLREDTFGEGSHSVAPQQQNQDQAIDPMLSFWGAGDHAFLTQHATGGADDFDAQSNVYVSLADVEGSNFIFDQPSEDNEFKPPWTG